MNRKISTIIPVWNCEKTIARAIQSVLLQDYPNSELIIMDGGSTDGTMHIISSFNDRIDNVHSGRDNGQTDALNRGFEKATGNIFHWLCADDELLPGAYHAVSEALSAQPDMNMVIGYSRRIYADGTTVKYTIHDRCMDRIGYFNGIDQPSAFWTADLHRKAGVLNDAYHYAMDWDWWNRLKQAGARAIVLPKQLSVYHFTDDNKTSNNPDGNVREGSQVIRTYGPYKGLLASIYLILYKHFDLKGCYDNPPTSSRARRLLWMTLLKISAIVFGKELVYSYNWHWCSCQKRNMKWY